MYGIKEMKQALRVSIYDKRNLENMKEYMKLALPTMCFYVVQWSFFDILTIMSGLISVKAQSIQVI